MLLYALIELGELMLIQHGIYNGESNGKENGK